jgi:hypothetical protein
MKIKHLLLIIIQVVLLVFYYELYIFEKYKVNAEGCIMQLAPLIKMLFIMNAIGAVALLMNWLCILFSNEKTQKILNYKLFNFKK